MLTPKNIKTLQRVASEPDVADTKYELKELLGSGGMGAVYRVYDRDLQREVALKVVQADLDEEISSNRLKEEARTLARLDHPGIVPVYEVGQLIDGRIYYTMKLIEGRRLDSAIDVTTTLTERLRIFQNVCATIGFAHSRSIAHLDLKPQNILVAPFGETLVVDWGIARVLNEKLRQSGVAGTPAYMAPEQLEEQSQGVDVRADVFALGRILKFMLTSMPDSPVPSPLEAICDRASNENPAKRYPSASELYEDITRFLDLKSVEAYRETWFETLRRWFEKNKVLAYLVLAYLFMRLIVALFFRN
jgi:eukaryotic-like serine/threonine-protein kinase